MEAKYCLIVDDHPLTADGLKAFIRNIDPSIQFFIAGGINEALIITNEFFFDHVFVDIHLGNENGADLIRNIKKINPQTFCVAMSGDDNTYLIEKMFLAGANAYISKSDPKELLESSITDVLKKRAQNRQSGCVVQSNEQVLLGLSNRVLEISNLLCKGSSNKEIARCLSISEDTVKSQLKRLFVKTNVSKRSEFVAVYSQAMKNLEL